jgi:hypothetical protein
LKFIIGALTLLTTLAEELIRCHGPIALELTLLAFKLPDKRILPDFGI